LGGIGGVVTRDIGAERGKLIWVERVSAATQYTLLRLVADRLVVVSLAGAAGKLLS